MKDTGLAGLLATLLSIVGTLTQEMTVYDSKPGRHLRVTTIEVEPYVMEKQFHGNGTDDLVYEGYMVDLLDLLAREVGFSYSLATNDERSYGHRRNDGTWSGMMGQLQREEVDIAAAPTFITRHRSKVVYFTRPFMPVFATLLLRKPPPGHPAVINKHTDLLGQSEIRYGTLDRGLIKKALRNANGTARQLFKNMRTFTPSAFTDSNEEGIRRVRREKFIYILPDTIGSYIAMRKPCDLTTADQFLLEAGYGIAVQKNKKGGRLRRKINGALRRLEGRGQLSRLRQKWWVDNNDCVRNSAVTTTTTWWSGVTLLLYWARVELLR